jgi:hypothetical protein
MKREMVSSKKINAYETEKKKKSSEGRIIFALSSINSIRTKKRRDDPLQIY